ncbi:CHAP domain-containing protein [Candidatus Saccharibacteria bacterium]|nr:CHAP domain-containing protein [Candidatus Saccharibacteria bacterium]
MVILRNIQKKLVAVIVAGILCTPVVVDVMMVRSAEGISLACSRSEACKEAVAKEQEANKNAAAASSSANMLQVKVNELNMQIANTELQIAETEAQVEDLSQQIAVTELKLKAEQDALAEILINMHFEGDAEPITILAGASSISDLAEKQARSEVVKQQISSTAAKVRQAKEQLEEDRAKVEVLLEEQQAAKVSLESTRGEQQALVTKYQNDAAAYEQVAKEALEAQRAAEQAEKEAHPERYGGSIYTGYNTYPWQADCPAQQDAYGTAIDGAYIGGYVCECVSYVGWKAYEAYGLTLAWGNANSWDDVARLYGYRVDNNPEPGTIGQVDDSYYGHVWWVESVNADGSINVTEYNNAYATYLYAGDFHYGDFGSRTISAADARYYNYIHLNSH